MASQLNQVFAQDAGRYCLIASMTILFFDYLLTLADEVRLFWMPRRFPFVVVFFLVTRYVSVLGLIPVVVGQLGWFGQDRCSELQYYHQALSAVVIILLVVLLIMRTYALYGCNRHVLWLLILAASVAGLSGGSVFLVGEITAPTTTTLQLPSFPCSPVVTQSQGYYMAAGWSITLAFDSMIFGMIVYRAFTVNSASMRWNAIFETMIRDGVLYYCVLMVLYVVNIATLLDAEPTTRGILVSLTNSMSSILMNHLMFNIRTSAQTRPVLLNLQMRQI